MSNRVNISSNIELPVSITILVLFSIVYSYLIMGLLDDYQPLENNPDWQGAHWIAAGETSGSGYFRKHFNVSSLPSRAYFIVSGTDKLSIDVNGETVGLMRYFGARPSQIFDVTRLLHVGDNLLAVRVDSNVLGVAPVLAGRLVLADADQQWRAIKSDQSWRVLRHEDFQQASKTAWNSPDYSDLHWRAADIVSAEQRSTMLPLIVPEYVYKTFPRGNWIWSGNNEIAVFTNEFTLYGSTIHDAWLGVSTMGRYSLVINGVPVVTQQGTEKTMELINISAYLQLGKNEIWLEVETEALLPRLLVSGTVTTDIGIVELDSTERWKTVLDLSASTGSGKYVPVTVMSAINRDVAAPVLTLVYKEIALSEILSARKIIRLFKVSLVVSLLTLTIFFLFYRNCRNYSVDNVVACFSLFIKPLVLGLIISVVLLLLPYDLSIDNYFLPWFVMLLIVPVVVLIFEALILLEMQGAGNQ